MAAIATIDFTNQNSLEAAGAAHAEGIQKLEIVIDTDSDNVNGLNIAAGDFPIFDVPGGWMFLGMAVEVLTAEGGTCTCGFGITGSLATYMAAAACNLNAAAGTIVTDVDAANASAGSAAGYLTAAAGETVRADIQNAMDTGKFRVTMLWVDMNGKGTTGFANQI